MVDSEVRGSSEKTKMNMDITRRAALIGLSAFAALPARAQSSPKAAPKQPNPEFAALEKPVIFDIATTSGSLKESVQNGQDLIWHRKGKPADRFFQIANIAVGLLRSETGGQLMVTFSCNVSSLGYMTSEEAKLNMIMRTKGGASLHAWAFGVPVKCTDKNQSVPPQNHEVPKDIAANVFTNTFSIEIAEYTEPNMPEQKAQHCD
jgi:hypothetical protein